MRDSNRDLGVVPMYIVNRSSRSDDGGKPTFWVVCSTYLGIRTYVVLLRCRSPAHLYKPELYCLESGILWVGFLKHHVIWNYVSLIYLHFVYMDDASFSLLLSTTWFLKNFKSFEGSSKYDSFLKYALFLSILLMGVYKNTTP